MWYDLGISVRELARNKEADMRATHQCWVSQELPASCAFRRLLCFEFASVNRAEGVDDVFRCLTTLRPLDSSGGLTVAMPLFGTGDAGGDKQAMLLAILQSCFNWAQVGMPLAVLRIAIFDKRDAKILLPIVKDFWKDRSSKAANLLSGPEPDLVFKHKQKETDDKNCPQDVDHR